MKLAAFTARAKGCTNMQQLEKLFIDERKFVEAPDWQFVRMWRENQARIEGDGKTGEVLDEYPF